jgi:hypothetical protein
MSVLLFWLALSVAVGIFAANRGRSGFGWFLLSLLLSPILGFIFVAVCQPKRQSEGRIILEAPTRTMAALNHDDDTRSCPHCAETIKQAARVCKHCSLSVEELIARLPGPESIQPAPIGPPSSNPGRRPAALEAR